MSSSIITHLHAPELTSCVCDHKPWFIKRQEGMVYLWNTECRVCGKKTEDAVRKSDAAIKWERMIKEEMSK